MLAMTELQKTVYQYLTNLGLTVRDTVPINSQLPYVQFNGFEVVPNRTKTHDRQDYILTLGVWIVDSGGREFHEMMKKVVSILDANLTMENDFDIDMIELDLLTTLKEEWKGDVVNHGVIQLRFTVTQK